MMLRTKQGAATFIVSHPLLPEPVHVDPATMLTPRQRRKMSTHPDLVVQFARFLADEFARDGYPGAEVRADVRVSLNGRPRQPLVDPAVNLAAVERTLGPAPWIVPLREPLRTRRLPWRPPARPEKPEPTIKPDAGDKDES
jgi:hypothetical protein